VREIHDHETNTVNKQLRIEADERNPENGNASHVYVLRLPPKTVWENGASHYIHFQDGPIGVVGINGVTNEALLAIVADRLQCFQTSEYACAENQAALSHVIAALGQLAERTKARESRGVEGTHEV